MTWILSVPFPRKRQKVMAKVIGLGGVFIKFNDPEKMRVWYRDALGMNTNDYGVLFAFNHQKNSRKGYLQLGTFESETSYFGDKSQQVMLNFRVDDISGLKNKLEELNTSIVNEIEEYPYGKFLHILDPEGNRIELWEPVDREFDGDSSTEMN